MSKDVAVLGVGMHPWGKWGKNFVEYGIAACNAALKDAGVKFSATSAWTALQTIRHTRFRVHGEIRTGVTPGSTRACQVLNALKLTERRPPDAPAGDETTM